MKKLLLFTCLALVLASGSFVVWGKFNRSETDQGVDRAQAYFTDVEVVDQNGEKHRLYSDLMKDKIVVIDAFYSGCENSCVVKARTFQKLQAHFGGRIGYTVNLLSFTVDQETDSPAVLNAHADKLGARKGWYFLTGKNVQTALHKFGQQVDKRENHKDLILVGNLKTGLWKKLFGLAPPDKIISAVENVINDTGKQ